MVKQVGKQKINTAKLLCLLFVGFLYYGYASLSLFAAYENRERSQSNVFGAGVLDLEISDFGQSEINSGELWEINFDIANVGSLPLVFDMSNTSESCSSLAYKLYEDDYLLQEGKLADLKIKDKEIIDKEPEHSYLLKIYRDFPSAKTCPIELDFHARQRAEASPGYGYTDNESLSTTLYITNNIDLNKEIINAKSIVDSTEKKQKVLKDHIDPEKKEADDQDSWQTEEEGDSSKSAEKENQKTKDKDDIDRSNTSKTEDIGIELDKNPNTSEKKVDEEELEKDEEHEVVNEDEIKNKKDIEDDAQPMINAAEAEVTIESSDQEPDQIIIAEEQSEKEVEIVELDDQGQTGEDSAKKIEADKQEELD